MLCEPAATDYDLHFRVLGVPVRVHPLFWLMSVLLGSAGVSSREGLWLLLIWVGVVFVSILIHELGHVAAFRYYGIGSHVVLWGFGGLAVPDSEIGWLTSRRARRGPGADAMIAFAGPLAGFAFAALVVAVVFLAGYRVAFESGVIEQLSFDIGQQLPLPPSFKFHLLVQYLLFVNIFWGIVNLLPVFPLDGGQIARALLTAANPLDGMRQSLMLSVGVAGGVALFAIMKWHEPYIALMFGMLAYYSYMTLQQFTGGGFGGRRW